MSSAAAATGRPTPARKSAWAKTAELVGTALTVLFVMVAAVLVVVALATRLSSKQQYNAFGHPVLVVLSGSMSPAIRTGDLIFDNRVTRARAQHLRRGEIITFADPPGSTTFTTHRIVGVLHQDGQVLYRTKGDANNTPDGDLRPSSSIVGTYAMKVPRGGYFLTNVHKPQVLGLLLLAPLLWLASGLLREWAREEAEPRKNPSDPDGDSEARME